MTSHKHVACGIFIALFAAYGYFHQGGGWNQNSRFNQIRAIVENQRFEINEYFLYQAQASAVGPVKVMRLSAPEYLDFNSIPRFANTFDISVVAGNVYPNKPPGTVLLALPAYWLIYHTELLLGVNPDDWWTHTFNSYLTTVFSVGLFTAFGGVVFYFVSRRLFPLLSSWVHVAATLAYALGTLIFPFGTLLFDHNLVATLSLCVFGTLLTKNEGGLGYLRESFAYFLAGVLCGLSIVVNYTAILSSACLLLYGLRVAKRKLNFAYAGFAGFVAPILLLMSYHAACFGSPFATANTYQYGMFRSADTALFGMLMLPSPAVAFEVLFPYYRGLFFTSPVLLLTALGLVLMANERGRRPETCLFASVFAAYLLMNSAFNHWHAGWTIGPRYLIPALPFLALPGAIMFARLPRLTGALALASCCIMLVATAVDPQVPTGIQNPLYDHVLRLFFGGRLEVNGLNIEGPVSVNPIGVYENWDLPADSIRLAERRWHSFNLGEFIWPGSRWSLVPLILFITAALVCIGGFLKPEEKSSKVS